MKRLMLLLAFSLFNPVQGALFGPKPLSDIDTELFKAVYAADSNRIERALAAGARINAKNKDGSTPLFAAIFGGKLAIVTLLLSKGADVNSINTYDYTPLTEATSDYLEGRIDLDIIEFLLQKGADSNRAYPPLYRAIEKKDVELARFLIEHGANVNHRYERSKELPLGVAILFQDLPMVQLLLSKGADVNARGSRALWVASREWNVPIARLLIEKGAQINQFKEGRYSLGQAVVNNDLKMAQFLIDHGAEVNLFLYSENFLTPLSLARSPEMKELLIKAGALPGWKLWVQRKKEFFSAHKGKIAVAGGLALLGAGALYFGGPAKPGWMALFRRGVTEKISLSPKAARALGLKPSIDNQYRYNEILKLPENASQKNIQKGLRELALKYHSDKITETTKEEIAKAVGTENVRDVLHEITRLIEPVKAEFAKIKEEEERVKKVTIELDKSEEKRLGIALGSELSVLTLHGEYKSQDERAEALLKQMQNEEKRLEIKPGSKKSALKLDGTRKPEKEWQKILKQRYGIK